MARYRWQTHRSQPSGLGEFIIDARTKALEGAHGLVDDGEGAAFLTERMFAGLLDVLMDKGVLHVRDVRRIVGRSGGWGLTPLEDFAATLERVEGEGDE